MMLAILSAVLFALILIFCGNKGAKSIATTCINGAFLLGMLAVINMGVPPFIVTLASGIILTSITLFYQNEVNIKSKVSFLSVLAVLLIVLPLVFWLIRSANAGGFNSEQYEITDANGYSRNIGISMPALEACVMIIALLGTLIDTSIAISSAIYEIRANNSRIPLADLMKSAFTVGKDVLNTSIHTIFYIYVAEYMTLMIQYITDYSFSYVINSKSLAGEFVSVSLSGIGCCLIVPVTAVLGSILIKGRDASEIDRTEADNV